MFELPKTPQFKLSENLEFFTNNEPIILSEIMGLFKQKYLITTEQSVSYIRPKVHIALKELFEHFNDLRLLKDKSVLDVGCGATGGNIEHRIFSRENKTDDQIQREIEQHREFEPWFLRVCSLLGAECVGVDLGENKEYDDGILFLQNNVQEFPDLSFLQGRFFDIIHMSMFLNSPNLLCTIKNSEEGKIVDLALQLDASIQKIIKPNGLILIDWEKELNFNSSENDVRYYNSFLERKVDSS